MMALVDPSAWTTAVIVAVFAAAAAAVWFAGARLARLANEIAERTGIGGALIGLLLLGGITSLPEAAVATTAALQGTPTLSIHDVLGSAAINVLLLAVADAFSGRDALTSRQASPGVLLQGVLSITLLAVVATAALVGDRPLGGIGALSWLILAGYLAAATLLARSRTEAEWGVRHGGPGRDAGERRHEGLPPRLLAAVGAMAAIILVAGFLLGRTAGELAERSGLGESFFGAVILGFCTSLPELSTVIAAVRLHQYEMAIADIFGTNLFNVTILVLVDALTPGGPVLARAGAPAGFAALLALVMTALFVIGSLERRDRTVLRMGWDSLLAVFAYAGGVWMLHGLSRT